MAKPLRYPFRVPALFTRGQEAALRAILADPGLRPPGVTSLAGLIRHYVWQGIIATGMPLGPTVIKGQETIGPVPPEQDTVQRVYHSPDAVLARHQWREAADVRRRAVQATDPDTEGTDDT